jgi:hypothetical protein
MTKVAIALAFVLGLAPAGLAAGGARTSMHSGTVVTIDPAGGVLIVAEVGPWRVAQGTTVVTRRSIVLTADTKFSSFIRVNAPGGFAGDFLEVELEADNVTPGDFVTAECAHERGGLVALRVSIAEVE